MRSIIENYLQQTVETIKKLDTIIDDIESAATAIVTSLKNGNKILICGNGGSAADAQHIETELISRFRKERAPIPAIALTTNTSILTAVANDYDFSKVFSRQVEALGNTEDVLIAITTSGNSKNIVEAAVVAREKNVKVIAMTGKEAGLMSEVSDILICIPSSVTSHIQEGHLAVYHLICQLVEEKLF